MRRMGLVALFALLFYSLLLGVPAVMAGESQDAIDKSNNTSDEPTFNLNIYEKDPCTFSCKTALQGNASIFRHKYSESAIQDNENETLDTTDLTGLESYTESSKNPSDDMPAQVMVPYEGENAYILSRVDLKPDKVKNDGDSGSILLSPKLIEAACGEDPTNHVDSMIKAGWRNIRNVYAATMKGFSRFRHEPSKEKSRPMETKGLFRLLGWFCQASAMDSNEDGNVDAYALNFVRIY